jgi:hypothetical protein
MIASVNAIAMLASARYSHFSRPLRRSLLQPLDRPLRKLRRGIEDPLRVLDQVGVPVGELGHDRRRALWRIQDLVQPAFALAQLIERGAMDLLQRQQRQLLRRLQELVAHAPVVFEQRRVFQDDLLPGEPFEVRRLLEQQAALASRLRCLQHLLAALRGEAIERQHQFRQRVHERQADEEKAQQDELEERARVVHENLSPDIIGRIMAPPSPGRRPHRAASRTRRVSAAAARARFRSLS